LGQNVPLFGLFLKLDKLCNMLVLSVAGEGFKPSTFGL